MDRRLKERLVGATILVALIVLIVPELLSGPKRPSPAPAPPAASGGTAEPVRNVTVDLATSKATAAPEPSAAAPASSADPAAPAGTGVDSDSASAAAVPPLRAGAAPSISTLKAQQPASPVLETESPPPISAGNGPKSAAARETAAPDSGRHGWSVQIGSFASRDNAEKQVHRVRSRDAPVYVSSGGHGASLRYRVRIGPFADRGAAERALLKLRKAGESASLVPP
jgi:DedD protein